MPLPPLVAIRALKDIADFAQFPALRGVIGVASVILEDVNAVKGNNMLRDQLSRQVAEAVLAIDEQLGMAVEHDVSIPDEVLCAIDGLNESLMRTHQLLQAQKSRKALSKFIHNATDNEVLKGCREDIQRAMDVYFLQANIFMQRTANALATPKTIDPRISELPDLPSPKAANVRKPNPQPSFTRLPPPPYLLLGRDDAVDDSVRWLLPPMRTGTPSSQRNGRNTELEHLTARAGSSSPSQSTASPVRHIAFLGPPGVGKTSVARKVLHCEAIIGSYGRRMFVDCAPHSTLAGVLTAMGVTRAQFLAFLRTAPSASVASDTLTGSASSQTIILLDALDVILATDLVNTEAFLDALMAIPDVSVLLTARGASTPASIPTNILKRVVLPPLDDIASKQLFTTLSDRAPDATTLRQADGLPLALELLAHCPEDASGSGSVSYVSSPIEYSNRLDKVIGRSVDLLTPEAKDCLAILSRAPDGLPRHLLPSAKGVSMLLRSALATERICQNKSTENTSSRDTNTNKEPNSAPGPGTGRILVLAPIRTYAFSQLQPSSTALTILRNHYFEVAQRARDVGSARTMVAVDLLGRELGNLTCVIGEAISVEEGAGWREAVNACLALAWWQLWVGTSDRTLLDTALQRLRGIGAERRTTEETALLSQCALALSRLQSPSSVEGRALMDESLDSARLAGDIGLQVDALTKRTVADARRDLERLGQAQELLDQLDPNDDLTAIRKARVLLELGQTHLSGSDLALATRYIQMARELTPELGSMLQLRARALYSYGHTCTWSNKPREAARAYSQALSECEAEGNSGGAAHSISYLATLTERQWRWEESQKLFDESAKRYAKLGYDMDGTLAKCGAVRVACRRIIWEPTASTATEIPELPAMPTAESGWEFGRGSVWLARGFEALAHAAMSAEPENTQGRLPYSAIGGEKTLSALVLSHATGSRPSASNDSTPITPSTSSSSRLLESLSVSSSQTSLVSPSPASTSSRSSFMFPPRPSNTDPAEYAATSARMYLDDAREFALAAQAAFRRRGAKVHQAESEALFGAIEQVSGRHPGWSDCNPAVLRSNADRHYIVAVLMLRKACDLLAADDVLRRWLGWNGRREI